MIAGPFCQSDPVLSDPIFHFMIKLRLRGGGRLARSRFFSSKHVPPLPYPETSLLVGFLGRDVLWVRCFLRLFSMATKHCFYDLSGFADPALLVFRS